MKTKLHLSADLALPIEAAGQTIGIIGIRGGGKTNTAGVIAEELLDANLPIAVIDPTDAWWGLRSDYPVVIFGGDHGDVPLLEESGKDIAEFVVSQRQPVILSIQHLSHAAQRRFVADFLLELYRLKAADQYRYPLTVLIDEAPLFVPQRVMGETARVVGAVENLVARGRKSGFGVVLISQRSATINKDVLTQADTMIVHRLTGLPDRKVLAEWMQANASSADHKAALEELAGLGKGDAWVWAPEADIFKRTHIRLRRTFDSSASPKIGARLEPPKRMAEVDLQQLTARLTEAVARRRENDPVALHRKIAEMQKQLAAKAPKVAPVPLPKGAGKLRIVKEHHEICPPGVVHDVELAAKAMIDAGKVQINRGKAMLAQAKRLRRWPDRYLIVPPEIAVDPAKLDLRTFPASAPPMAVRMVPHEDNGGTALRSGARRILQELAARYPATYSRAQVGGLTGFAHTGGTFTTYLGDLKRVGYVAEERGEVIATLPGIQFLGADIPRKPTTHAEAMALWRQALRKGAFHMLQWIVEARERGCDRVTLAGAVQMTATGGTFTTYLGDLKRNGLVTEQDGLLTACDILFAT